MYLVSMVCRGLGVEGFASPCVAASSCSIWAASFSRFWRRSSGRVAAILFDGVELIFVAGGFVGESGFVLFLALEDEGLGFVAGGAGVLVAVVAAVVDALFTGGGGGFGVEGGGFAGDGVGVHEGGEEVLGFSADAFFLF